MPDINPLPVSEETRERLQAVKGEDESYDDLLQALVTARHRGDLDARYHSVAEADAAELVPADELEPEASRSEARRGRRRGARSSRRQSDDGGGDADPDGGRGSEDQSAADPDGGATTASGHETSGHEASEHEASDDYDVLCSPAAVARLEDEPEHTQATIYRQCEGLAENASPPEAGTSTASALPFGAENWFHERFARHWTVFYLVAEEAKEVRIVRVERYEDAAPKYDI